MFVIGTKGEALRMLRDRICYVRLYSRVVCVLCAVVKKQNFRDFFFLNTQ